MKIQQNTDVQYNPSQNQDNAVAASGAGKSGKAGKTGMIKGGNLNSVSGAGLSGQSLIQQRQGFAKKQALKVVSDAFDGEKKLDAQMQSIKDEIKRLQDEIDEKTADKRENDAKLKELQEEYGVDPDSKEHKELSVLAAKMRNPKVGVSDEEMSRLSEYQKKALYYVTSNQQNSLDIDHAKAIQVGNVQGFSDMKRERAKSQDMLKAQEAAEDIMEASDGEMIALLTKEAVEHIDEEQKEREKEAEEIAEKKAETKEEKREEELYDIVEESGEKIIISDKASMEDTQDAVNTEIANILNKLSLLSNDVKGSSIDDMV